jgi:hypothetical protein
LELPKFPNLESLKFHSRYDAPLLQNGKKILPESLIKLSFPRESHFNQELKQYNLPSNLQELHFGIFFNNEERPFIPDFLPPTLKKITLDRLITNGTDKYITVLHISLPRPTNTPINIPGGKNRNLNLIPEKSYSESVKALPEVNASQDAGLIIDEKHISKNLKIIRNNNNELIFNYGLLLENADEIHIMESSFRQLMETLNIKTKKLFLYKGRDRYHAIPLQNKKTGELIGTKFDWKVIDSNIFHKKKWFFN